MPVERKIDFWRARCSPAVVKPFLAAVPSHPLSYHLQPPYILISTGEHSRQTIKRCHCHSVAETESLTLENQSLFPALFLKSSLVVISLCNCCSSTLWIDFSLRPPRPSLSSAAPPLFLLLITIDHSAAQWSTCEARSVSPPLYWALERGRFGVTPPSKTTLPTPTPGPTSESSSRMVRSSRSPS